MNWHALRTHPGDTRRGGGILSVNSVKAATGEQPETTKSWVSALAKGTTTIEIKSGYD
ncbi:MAG: hypothetical protein ACLUEQ_11515 [Cloacibacillus evryensis]